MKPIYTGRTYRGDSPRVFYDIHIEFCIMQDCYLPPGLWFDIALDVLCLNINIGEFLIVGWSTL